METLYDKMYPKGTEDKTKAVCEIYGVFTKEPKRLDYIIDKQVNGPEWKKVQCFYPDKTGKKLMVFVANTSEYFLSGVEFKDELPKNAVMDVCIELNWLLFWEDVKSMLRIVCSVKRTKEEELETLQECMKLAIDKNLEIPPDG